MNSPHKGQVTRKMFPFEDVIRSHDLSHRGLLTPYSVVDLRRINLGIGLSPTWCQVIMSILALGADFGKV